MREPNESATSTDKEDSAKPTYGVKESRGRRQRLWSATEVET